MEIGSLAEIVMVAVLVGGIITKIVCMYIKKEFGILKEQLERNADGKFEKTNRRVGALEEDMTNVRTRVDILEKK